MPLPDRLTKRLRLDLPILQAPMAGAQGAALAVAVSRAGGLGAIPCAMLTAETARREVQLFRQQTDRPLNLNFFCHARPAPDPARLAAWKARLAPQYRSAALCLV